MLEPYAVTCRKCGGHVGFYDGPRNTKPYLCFCAHFSRTPSELAQLRKKHEEHAGRLRGTPSGEER